MNAKLLNGNRIEKTNNTVLVTGDAKKRRRTAY